MKFNHFSLFIAIFFLLTHFSCKTEEPATSAAAQDQRSTKNENEASGAAEPSGRLDTLPTQAAQYYGFTTSHGPYNPSDTRRFDLLHTKLEVSFDWQQQYVNGNADLQLVPYFYPQDTLTLDAVGFDIHAVELVSNGAASTPEYIYNDEQVKIILPETFTREDTFQVRMDYTAKPNELPVGGSAAITEDKGLYFINPLGEDPDKPRQIWTQGETEANSRWFPTIDSPNERTTQEMYITVDTQFVALSNGELVYKRDNQDGTSTYYWNQELPHAPYLFMIAVGDFSIVEGEDWNGKPVNYYVEEEWAEYADDVFGNTHEMMTFFSDILDYPYPWAKYSQVVVRDFVSGAMENTSASVFMEALNIDDRALLDNDWDYIIAHELFHHWFGDLVTTESWANLPLNESFANYSEYLWAEHHLGVDEADLHYEEEMQGYLDEARQKQEPLIRYRYLDKEDMFDRHSYNKGGRVLHMLRNEVGDAAFFEALNLYLRENKYQAVEIANLRLAFEEVTGEDMHWFFDQWFMEPGHPVVRIENDYNDGVATVRFWQLQDTSRVPVYRLTMPVDIWVNGERQRHDIVVDEAYEQFEFNVEAEPELVLYDPESLMLGEKLHEKSDEELLFQYYNGERYLSRMEALEWMFMPKLDTTDEITPAALSRQFQDPEIRKLLLNALQDPFWKIREYAVDQFRQFDIQDMPVFLDEIQEMAESDPKPAVRAKAIFVLSEYDNQAFVEIFEQGLEARPYSVLAASLSALLKDTTRDIDLEPYENIDNLNLTLTLANHYLQTGETSKYPWFYDTMISNMSRPQALYNMLYFFGQYLQLLDEEQQIEGRELMERISEENKYEVIRNLADKYIQQINTSLGN